MRTVNTERGKVKIAIPVRNIASDVRFSARSTVTMLQICDVSLFELLVDFIRYHKGYIFIRLLTIFENDLAGKEVLFHLLRV